MSDNNIIVTKSSGLAEAFDTEKLRNSLRRSGAHEALINQVMQEMSTQLRDGVSTKSIYKHAFKLLKKAHRPTAARYNLKQAMFAFGNSGFPFEDFVGEILKSLGYETRVRQLVQGRCVQHEVDVLASNEDTLIWIECKYHPQPGSVSNVKIPLYIHSRFRDMDAFQETHHPHDHRERVCWIVTNTRFSEDAMTYGRCAGLQLVGWNYPSGKSLRDLVDRAGLYPVTCLTTLSQREKSTLLENGIVLCSTLTEAGKWTELLLIAPERRRRVMQEAASLCGLNQDA